MLVLIDKPKSNPNKNLNPNINNKTCKFRKTKEIDECLIGVES